MWENCLEVIDRTKENLWRHFCLVPLVSNMKLRRDFNPREQLLPSAAGPSPLQGTSWKLQGNETSSQATGQVLPKHHGATSSPMFHPLWENISHLVFESVKLTCSTTGCEIHIWNISLYKKLLCEFAKLLRTWAWARPVRPELIIYPITQVYWGRGIKQLQGRPSKRPRACLKGSGDHLERRTVFLSEMEPCQVGYGWQDCSP